MAALARAAPRRAARAADCGGAAAAAAAGRRAASRRRAGPRRASARAAAQRPGGFGAGGGAAPGFGRGAGGGAGAADQRFRAGRSTGPDLERLPELVQEVVRVTLATGPRGARRGAEAARAGLLTAGEVLSEAQPLLARGDLEGLGRLAPSVLRRLFERLGATYVKLGQFIASSPTLFPPEYVEEFAKCLDRAPPVPWAEIERVLVADLGRPVDEVFEFIDRTPLATASVAQVHRATLRGSGRDVAVKVLKPGVEDVLTADLNFIYVTARTLEFLAPELARTSLSAVVSDIRESMLEEVDLNKEARNIEEFQRFLDTTGLGSVAKVPVVFKNATSTRVLTTEFIDGVSLTDLDALEGYVPNPEATLINALNTWFASVLGAESFHADVHAGNLLALRDGRVAFIDFGIVGRVPPVIWGAVEALLLALPAGDYDTTARALVQMGATDTQVDIEAFARDLKEVFAQAEALDASLDVVLVESPPGAGAGPGGAGATAAASVSFDEAQVNRLLLEIVRVSDGYGLKLPREFGLLVKQILYFDKYVRLLAPDLQVLDDERVNLPRSGYGGAPGAGPPAGGSFGAGGVAYN